MSSFPKQAALQSADDFRAAGSSQTERPSRVSRRSAAAYAGELLLITVAYFVGGKLGLAVPFTSGNISPVWPPAGIALAGVLVYGYRIWPAVALGAFLVNFFSPIPHAAALGLATGNTLAALTGGYLLKRAGVSHSFARLPDVLGLIFLGSAITPIVSASVGITVLYFTHVNAWSSLSSAWLIYWLGDGMGILLVVPLLTLSRVFNSRNRPRAVELGAIILLLTVSSVVLFDDRLGVVVAHDVFAFALFPFLMWAALRFGVVGSSITSLVLSSIAVWETAHYSGPFARSTHFLNAAELQVFIAVMSISGLVVGAVITERREAEQQRAEYIREQAAQAVLLESEKQYRRIVETTSEGVWTLDKNFNVSFVNSRISDMLGYSSSEMLGRPVFEFLFPEDVPRKRQDLFRRQRGVSEYLEERIRRKDGSEIWTTLATTPILNHHGEFDGVLAMATDITERKRAEKRVEAQHLVTRILAESAMIATAVPRILEAVCQCLTWDTGAIWLTDPEANALRCIDTWAESPTHLHAFSALTRRTLFKKGLGLPGRVWASGQPSWIRDVTVDPNFPRAAAAVSDGLHGAFGFPIVLGTQTLGVIEFFSYEIREPDEDLVEMMAAIGSQIGQFVERKRAEQAVLESEERYRTVAETASDAIFIIDGQSTIVFANKASDKTFGYTPEELLNKKLTMLMPEYLRKVHEAGLGRYLQTGKKHFSWEGVELTGLHKSGHEFPVEVSFAEYVKTGGHFFTGFVRDITDRKRAEEALRGAEKRATAGQVAAMIAHEINNPLEAVINILYLLSSYPNLDEKARSYVQSAEVELGRVAHISKQTLAFHRDTAAPVPLEPTQIMESVLEVYAGKLQQVLLEKHYDAVPQVSGYPGELRQLFSNLVGNALEATQRRGKLAVRIHRSRDWRNPARHGVRIVIADNGSGIAEEHRTKIFEPFFTTKGEKGTGLGLWVSQTIVQKHRGLLAVRSSTNPGRSGTIFSIFLPEIHNPFPSQTC